MQIEGGHASGDRGRCIWDALGEVPGAIKDGSGANHRGVEHIEMLETDLNIMKELSLDSYRFSISWPRVQPTGSGAFNEKGMAFYDRLIDGLLERDIQPNITLYHWDLPQALEDRGGWPARDTAARCAEYAHLVVRALEAGSAIRGIGEPELLRGLIDDLDVPEIKAAAIARAAGAKVLQLPINLGVGGALRCGRLDAVRLAPEGLAARMRRCVPADVLARVAQAEAATVVLDHRGDVIAGDAGLNVRGWRAGIGAGCERFSDTAGLPGRAIGAASDHDAVGTRLVQRVARVLGQLDVGVQVDVLAVDGARRLGLQPLELRLLELEFRLLQPVLVNPPAGLPSKLPCTPEGAGEGREEP